jgi:hypothetical protein
VSGLERLGKYLPGDYLQQLAEQGPDALPQVQALLGLSRTQLGSLRSTRNVIATAGASLGRYEATNLYGRSVTTAQAGVNSAQGLIRHLQAEEKTYQQRADKRAAHIEAVVERAADRIAKHEGLLILPNGKVLARLVNEENRKAARR